MTKFLPSPASQLGIISLLLVADHASSFFDHSRVSNEPFCLTAALTGDSYDSDKGRLIFGALGAALTAFSAYLKKSFKEVSCCAMYPTIMFLLFDILTKVQTWKKGEPLVGDAIHRGLVYTIVQVLDILLSSASIIGLGVEKGMIGESVAPVKTNTLGHVVRFGAGSLSYVAFIGKVTGALVSGAGGKPSDGAIKTMAESGKLVGLNIVGNLFPLLIDQMNASAMMFGNPRQLNNKCFVK